MSDLTRESLAAQDALTKEERRHLLSIGVSKRALAWGWVGAQNVLIEGPCWQPVTGGTRAFIVPVRAFDAITPEWSDPEDVLCFGDLVDLIAFTLDSPQRWALRLDHAKWLGACEPQLLGPSPVSIQPHPLAWLQQDCQGIVPLVRKHREIYSLLAPFRSIVAHDVAHGRELRRIMERPFPTPRIFIRREADQEIAA